MRCCCFVTTPPTSCKIRVSEEQMTVDWNFDSYETRVSERLNRWQVEPLTLSKRSWLQDFIERGQVNAELLVVCGLGICMWRRCSITLKTSVTQLRAPAFIKSDALVLTNFWWSQGDGTFSVRVQILLNGIEYTVPFTVTEMKKCKKWYFHRIIPVAVAMLLLAQTRLSLLLFYLTRTMSFPRLLLRLMRWENNQRW